MSARFGAESAGHGDSVSYFLQRADITVQVELNEFDHVVAYAVSEIDDDDEPAEPLFSLPQPPMRLCDTPTESKGVWPEVTLNPVECPPDA